MSASQTMHINHIASGDLWAGAEVQLFTLCKALNHNEGISVSVILLNHGTLEHKLRECSIPVEVLDESQLNSFQIGQQIFQLLRLQRPDVVHTHRIKENIIGSLAAKLAHIPSLRTVHGAPEHRPGWFKPHKRLIYAMDWFTGQYIQSRIIAVSEELKERLKTKFTINKIRVIENGIDIESLAPYKKPAMPEETNEQKSYKVGLVGRLVPVKRADLFIQIARHLRDHHPELPVQFHIFGDGPLRVKLEQLARTLNLENTVHFEGHSSNIHPQIASLNALLITSDHEGLPMTLLEAMALGTAVVAHAVGGINSVCQNGDCCWLVDNNSIESLTHTLLECLQNPKARQARKKLAQKQIQKHYSAEVNSKLYTDEYLNMVSKLNPDHT